MGLIPVNILQKAPKLFGENNGKSKFTNDQIESVFLLLIITPIIPIVEISNITEVTEGTIRSISQGVNHTWLREKYPNEYRILDNLKYNRNSHSSSALAKGIVYPNIINPAGEVFKVDNTSLFSKTHGLTQGNLHGVLTGRCKSHKGWTLA